MNLEHANPALFAALASAQGEIENASKNSSNPHFKSKYADLAEVLNTVRPTFSKHGLSIIQSTEFDGSLVSVTTTIAHKDGGYVSSRASCVPAKTDAQGVGSATTYLRRYSLASATGVAQEDDDGQTAAHDGKPVAKTASKPVTEKQLADLQDRMDANGTNKEVFFKALGITCLSDITTQEKYAQAVAGQDKKDASVKKDAA